MRCRFRIDGTEVAATTKYAGAVLSGKAKCDPCDNFSEEIGKKLAEKRLEYKVAKKRERYYTDLMNKTYNEIFELSKKFAKICKKRGEAVTQMYAAAEDLDDYMRSINS